VAGDFSSEARGFGSAMQVCEAPQRQFRRRWAPLAAWYDAWSLWVATTDHWPPTCHLAWRKCADRPRLSTSLPP